MPVEQPARPHVAGCGQRRAPAYGQDPLAPDVRTQQQAAQGLAWFSAGALTGAIGSAAALAAGVSYRGVYLALAVVMAAGLAATLFAAIPAPPLQAGASAGRRTPRCRWPAGPRPAGPARPSPRLPPPAMAPS